MRSMPRPSFALIRSGSGVVHAYEIQWNIGSRAVKAWCGCGVVRTDRDNPYDEGKMLADITCTKCKNLADKQ